MSEITRLVSDYLSIQQTIKTLESEAALIKDKIAEQYSPGSEPVKDGNTVLSWVTGRRSEKVDTKELRKAEPEREEAEPSRDELRGIHVGTAVGRAQAEGGEVRRQGIPRADLERHSGHQPGGAAATGAADTARAKSRSRNDAPLAPVP